MKVAVFEADSQEDLKQQLEKFFEYNPAAKIVWMAQSESRPMFSGMSFGTEISVTLLYT